MINWETIGVLTAVFSAIASIALWAAKRMFASGKNAQRLTQVETDISTLDGNISKQLNGTHEQITVLSAHMDKKIEQLNRRIDKVLVAVVQKNATEAHSPRQLSDEGRRILRESKIDQIVNEHFDQIVDIVRSNDPDNAYQVEQFVVEAVQVIGDDSELRPRIEEGAFQSGSLVVTVLYVGAIYIRDRVLAELGMKSKEEDDTDDSDTDQDIQDTDD